VTLAILTLWACSFLPGAPEDHDHGGGDHDDHGEAGHEEEGTIELSPTAVATARIQSDVASEAALSQGLSLTARIALDPRKEAIVSTWISGQVDSIAVRPGDTVTKGQRLGQVQSPELGEATAAYRGAKARDDAADARLARLQRLEADGVTSRAQVLEAEADHAAAAGALEAAEERLLVLGIPLEFGAPHDGTHFPSRVPVRSPIAGTVLTADASVGQRVAPGETLFHVGALDEVWLLMDAFERDLAAVREGQTVTFTVEAWPDETFAGTVAQVGDWIEPTARTVEVRVVVANADHRLKPNMFARAELTVDQAEVTPGIVLPRDAVQTLGDREVVFVEQQPGRYIARTVIVADRTADRVRLASGVAPGERVVTSGAFTLKSELEKGELGHGHAH
jgi:cobalt-zinc-cadmium efflux system membrane fusion protein